MKKSSFQIQQYIHDKGWVKITHGIKNTETQKHVAQAFLEIDEKFLKSYSPLYRMRLRDKSWFYFSANPAFHIVNGKLNPKEDKENA